MKVELVRINGEIVGWQIIAETTEDKLRVGSIRNMQFWGFGDTAIKYNGVTSDPEDERYAMMVEWVQKKHLNHQSKTQKWDNMDIDEKTIASGILDAIRAQYKRLHGRDMEAAQLTPYMNMDIPELREALDRYAHTSQDSDKSAL